MRRTSCIGVSFDEPEKSCGVSEGSTDERETDCFRFWISLARLTVANTAAKTAADVNDVAATEIRKPGLSRTQTTPTITVDGSERRRLEIPMWGPSSTGKARCVGKMFGRRGGSE